MFVQKLVMNGQQLTNSSNSANGTPSSSYPESLSSQSSRDPSPGTQQRKPLPESFNHLISSQTNHWPSKGGNQQLSSHTSPAPTPPAPSLTQVKPQIQDFQNSVPQSVEGPPQTRPQTQHITQTVTRQQPPSQFTHNFQPPTSLPQPFPPPSVRQPSLPVSQSNHLPQSSSLSNPSQSTAHPSPSSAQNVQPLEKSRSFQSPYQSPSNQFQSSSGNASPQPNNQFQKPSVPFQPPQPYQFQTMPGTTQSPKLNSQQFRPTQPPTISQPPQQMPLPQSRLPQSANQTVPPQNQIPPQHKLSQPHSLLSSTYQSNQAPRQIPQNPPSHPNQLSAPPTSAMPPMQNKFIQPSNQLPPPAGLSSQIPPPLNQLYRPPNQFSQTTNQISQPPNHYTQPPNQRLPNSMAASQPQSVNTAGLGYQNQYSNSSYPPPLQANNQFNKRYPQMTGFQQQPNPVDGLTPHIAGMTVQQGFNKVWGMDSVDLLKCRDLLPKEKIEPPHIRLQHELYESANCSPEIFRCTLTKIPETKSLLDKSRLPLGVLIHPFKDLNQLSVIQCTVIVRCRSCRTYINPFVYFVDNKRWKCNLCFRVNELPDEFQFDPMTKTYGDPSRRPEIKSATIEFIAPSEYMVRPPQPAVYVFVLDVSRLACECGYLSTVCRTLLSELDNLPGDARTSVAFITFDSAVHFYSLAEGQGQPHEMTVVDIEDMFLPTPDNLLVNLNDCRDLVRDLLEKLSDRYKESYDTHSALGPALQAAYKLLAPTGGRVTVFQSCLPNVGPGALTAREDPAARAGDNPPHLNPSTDFYKKLALDCSGQQIAVDLFLVNSQYLDLATLSGVSRFSGGCMFHIPLFRSDKPLQVETLERMFQRYLTRKIGFESVMRLRCTRGLSIHTFHGNFFVRSTDLLSLPNANPDAGFGMQVTIEENLTDIQNVCFQAALLYTSSKGERRIRVHTLCLPVAANLSDILHSADQQCIVGLLVKMAADRAVQSSLSDAREAFLNVVGDVLSAYRLTQSSNPPGCMLAPTSLRLLPLYILALLKHVAFRVGQSTRLDDRVFAMCQMKSLPLTFLMQSVYPDLYPLLNIEHQPEISVGEHTVPQPPRLQLSAERIDSLGMFLMDDGCSLMIYVGHNLNPTVCQAVFNVPQFSEIPQELYSIPELDNPISEALRCFISYLQSEKPYAAPVQVIRDDSHYRVRFLERLIEDKNESGTSYYEFLQRVKTLLK